MAQGHKVIGEEEGDIREVEKAIELVESLIKDEKIALKEYKMGLKLDLARLYHLVALIFKDKDNEKYRQGKV